MLKYSNKNAGHCIINVLNVLISVVAHSNGEQTDWNFLDGGEENCGQRGMTFFVLHCS